jgi:hypothetical protein
VKASSIAGRALAACDLDAPLPAFGSHQRGGGLDIARLQKRLHDPIHAEWLRDFVEFLDVEPQCAPRFGTLRR